MNIIPTEAEEQVAFVQWLRLRRYNYWRTPNETYTNSWKQKALNKALGVQSGIPDLFVIVNNRLIGVEMKRRKGGVVSPSQKLWIERLGEADIEVFVCRGAQAAIDCVQRVVKEELGVNQPESAVPQTVVVDGRTYKLADEDNIE